MPIKSRIRTIPDYPKPGIMFRDITTLFQDAEGFRLVVEEMTAQLEGQQIDKIAGIEARGFLLAGALAPALNAGVVTVRKKGKLPGVTIGQDYQLEYGTDRIEIHVDAVEKGERILLVDDLIATGGTAKAAATLLDQVGAEIIGCSFIIDLPDLGGSKMLMNAGYKVNSLVEFEGD